MTTLPPTETPCPGTATTQATCSSLPNGLWVPSATGGRCHCCKTDGTTYRDPNDPAAPCKSCSSNGLCGAGNGLCKGSCGSWEWFGFMKCGVEPTTGVNQCQFSLTQWKSWLFYGLIVLSIVLLIAIIVSATRPRHKATVYVPVGSTPPRAGGTVVRIQ